MQEILDKFNVKFIEDFNQIPQFITKKFHADVKYCLIIDENIHLLYCNDFQKHFNEKNLIIKVLKSGENNKNRENLNKVLDFLFENNFERNDIIIGMGGGVITDFAGCLASQYMRGVKVVLIPTTLLAIVDASIGSKTAVNTDYGKNTIGSFYDPSMVIVCVQFLYTLSERHFSNGMAEIIKAALICDNDFFGLLMNYSLEFLIKNHDVLKQVIETSMKIKLCIVNEDKLENSQRKWLNLGHTIGHGLEFASNQCLLHGECLLFEGIIKECEIAVQNGLLMQQNVDIISKCLQQYNLPIDFDDIDLDQILYYMQSDKKNQGGNIHFVFLKEIGQCYKDTFPIMQSQIRGVLGKQITIQYDVNHNQQRILTIPGSKSITNRVLLLAALAEGTVQIENFLEAEDTLLMLQALEQLGACQVTRLGNNQLLIEGFSGKLKNSQQTVYVGNSGTTARFLIPVLQLIKGQTIIQGNDRMKQRPISDLLESLVQTQQGISVSYLECQNQIPIELYSELGQFQGGFIQLKSQISSQFVSALLMVSPYAQETVILTLSDVQDDKITSEPFIQMTIDIMKQFGIQVERLNKFTFRIPKGVYKNPKTYLIEPDATTATYDLAYAVLCGGQTIIKGLGVNSLQGDSKFSQDVLQKMGVNIYQDNNDLTIENNNQLKAIQINMSDMTDTFITLAIISSQALGITKITGISNQRLKECDRIKAMIRNLKVCGYYCRELEDGMEIHGNPITKQNSQISKKVLIKTYKDHRIAMSFSILQAYFSKMNHTIQIIIDDRFCVNKTFPQFYNHIQQNYGAILIYDVVVTKKQDNDDCIYLIGMRASGKSFLAQAIAQNLNYDLVDIDYEIEASQGISISELVANQGWKKFREIESQVLQKFAQQQKKKCIIACGGGVIEDQDNVLTLKNLKNVIWIERPELDDIKRDLQNSNRPQLINNDLNQVYALRLPKYQQLGKSIFTIPANKLYLQEDFWIRCQERFQKFVNPERPQLLLKENTYMLCLFVEDLFKVIDYQQASFIECEYNMIELRVDRYLMDKESNKIELRKMIASIKQFLRIPIVITLRSQEQGGYFTGDYLYEINKILKHEKEENIVIDLEFRQKNLKLIKKMFLSKQNMILSNHLSNQDNETEIFQLMKSVIEEHNKNNINCILKLVLHENSSQQKLTELKSFKTSFPSIIIQLGNQLGKFSRIQNKFMTPVYDPRFSFQTGKGQMTKEEIEKIKKEFQLKNVVNKFYIIRENVSASLSPQIHNMSFKINQQQLDHFYDRFEAKNLNDIRNIVSQNDFVGASISMPFKQDVIQLVDHLIEPARQIQAVNTLVKFQNQIYGFNFDWLGIYNPLKKYINLKQINYGLIFGAGATCDTCLYVFKMLNIIPIIFNRSKERLMKFQSIQTFYVMEELKDYLNKYQIQLNVIFSAIPPNADVNYPDEIFHANSVIFESSYRPKQTRFLDAAQKNKCQLIIHGIEMLLEQAFYQMELFTGKPTDKDIYKKLYY